MFTHLEASQVITGQYSALLGTNCGVEVCTLVVSFREYTTIRNTGQHVLLEEF